jgi:hypothetical protein
VSAGGATTIGAVSDQADKAGGVAAWFPVLSSLAAAAAFLYVIGGLVLSIRFARADVPAARAISLVPASRLVETALSGLVLPVVGLILVCAAALWVRRVLYEARPQAPRRKIAVRTTFIAFGLFLILAAIVGVPPTVAGFGIWAVVSAWGFFVLWVGRPLGGERANEPLPKALLTVSALIAFSAAILIAETEKPTKLEPARVRLRDGSEVRGLFIAQTGEALYVGQPRAIVAIPNERLQQVRIGPPPRRKEQRGLADRWLRDLFGIQL